MGFWGAGEPSRWIRALVRDRSGMERVYPITDSTRNFALLQ